MTWGDAYGMGWRASKRADELHGADADMDAAVTRFKKRFAGIDLDGAYITGWNDQAVGNDYDEKEH
jgi:hypothetical protein